MIATRAELGRSRSSKSRPASSGMPSVEKYPGATLLNATERALLLRQDLADLRE